MDPRTSATYTEPRFFEATPSPSTFTEFRQPFLHDCAVRRYPGRELPEDPASVARLVLAA
ncbi:hypothetical protein ACGF3J_36810 [Streptomyces sp. NPDC048171]|uniref:hypothetical protein n=1 Tax=Streptomyces sp. NPDC048171 TaxID=3365504 RepID=UPI0037159E6B